MSNLHGRKLLLVREADERGQPVGPLRVAVDTVSAGAGDLVLLAAGSSARQTALTVNAPVDLVIVGVIDSLETGGTVTYWKE